MNYGTSDTRDTLAVKHLLMGEFAQPNLLALSAPSALKREYMQLEILPMEWWFYRK
jgi:hypothetical protein